MTLKTHKKKRIEIMIEAAALHRIIEVLDRFGVTDLVGQDAFYASGDDLLKAYRQRTQ